jgi:hypothetical protein
MQMWGILEEPDGFTEIVLCFPVSSDVRESDTGTTDNQSSGVAQSTHVKRAPVYALGLINDCVYCPLTAMGSHSGEGSSEPRVESGLLFARQIVQQQASASILRCAARVSSPAEAA